MKKNVFLIMLFTTIAMGLGVYVSFVSTKTKTPPLLAIHYAAPPPAVNVISNPPTNVLVRFVGTSPNLPPSVFQYRFTTHLYSEGEAKNIASKLGFSLAPKKLLYGQEKRTVWENERAALLFVENKSTQFWSYSLFSSTKRLSPTLPRASVAKSFLEQTFFSYDPTIYLKESLPDSSQYVSPRETPRPSLFGFLFTKHPEEYPFYTSRFSASPITIVVDEYGEPRLVSFSSQIDIVREISVPIISVSDAVASINSGLGELISITINGGSYWEKTPQFKTASLSSVQLVYYANQKTSLLVPFYLFTGTADTTDGVVVEIVYAVSAVEQVN